MTVKGTPPGITSAGEYGATTVEVSMDGSSMRLAFGRNGRDGNKTYHGAVLLSPEAIAELKKKIIEIESL